MDFYTIDFETANANLTSSCSIGLVGVKNGKIITKQYYLINPEEEFLPSNIMIHGITSEMVKNEKTFPDVWKEISSCFNNTVIFAHCASFDLAVLYATLTKYNIPKPSFHFSDTLMIAKTTWPKEVMSNHKLNTIAKYLEVEHSHHNALSDALVCVYIVNQALKIYQASTIPELHDKLYLRFGYFSQLRFFNPHHLNKRYQNSLEKINNPNLYNKLVIYSGNPKHYQKQEFINLLLKNGAYIDTIVSKKMDYFIKLDKYKEDKLKQVEKLINEGINIIILSEEELLRVVNNNELCN